MTDMEKFCRYKIIMEYCGLFDDKHIIAYCETLSDAEILVDSLKSSHDDCLYEFSYERIADFDKFLDTNISLFDLT